jgi:uncharacterized protein (TIGR04562 family)
LLENISTGHELQHELFGSVLDRSEMTPFLLLRTEGYEAALDQATRIMGNRGFDTPGNRLPQSERSRAEKYIAEVYKYFFEWMLPFAGAQLEQLIELNSPNHNLYLNCLRSINNIEGTLKERGFRQLIEEDPRHLFLLASSGRYPHLFDGYRGKKMEVPVQWKLAACSILKMAHLIKSVEEDSQDINDYAELGFFLEAQGVSLQDLYNYNWEMPLHRPETESAQKAFVKISTFFLKLKESMLDKPEKKCLVFNSGDGVEVEITELKARLKSPESMFTKLGKDVEGEAFDIRDILAITFILKSRDDSLKLVHALQKRGVILQENTVSHSITQTLFDDPESMKEAVRRLMISLSQTRGIEQEPGEGELAENANKFYEALSLNAAKNRFSSVGHRKFQCKINFSLPVHRTADTNEIMIPGTAVYARRDQVMKKTQQHTLGVELRISDEESWSRSEQKGDSHHDAYKFRQLVSVMNRVFKNMFHFPETSSTQLKRDQADLFS